MPTCSRVTRCLRGVSAAAVLVCSAAGIAAAQFSISRFTVDGGGSTRSTGGTLGLGGTIGQLDAGRLSGSNFVVNGGFWFGGGGTATSVESGTSGDGVNAPAGATLTFQLYPARPNPVVTQTLVAFDLASPSAVRVALYDVSGRLVRLLVDEPLPAGHQFRAWDRRNASGQSVPAGIYFLRLDAGEHHSHQKIVVIS